MALIDQLINQEYLKSPSIIEAFRKIERADFVPNHIIKSMGRDEVNKHNAPIEIGHGQTISQPLTVAFMLELLQPKPGDKILDVGSGTGWQTALLAHIVGDTGEVYAMEIIIGLYEFGKRNVAKYNFNNVKFILGNARKGLAKYAPFDKIVVAAGADEVPEIFLKQLTVGGRLVIPIKSSIWLYIKNNENDFDKKEFPGFVFVPLVHRASQQTN